jgi:hypothetical protein
VNLANLILLCVLAPTWYCVIGLLWSGWTARDKSRRWLTPLFGIIASGLAGEIALICGGSYKSALIILWLASVGAAWLRKPELEGFARISATYLWAYSAGIAAIAAAPFPVLGPWSGDWMQNIQLADSVRIGTYAQNQIGRTPLYGGAGAWLAFVGPRLPAAQCHSAAVAAGMVLVLQFWRVAQSRSILTSLTLLPLVGSCFYLNHVKMMWAKLLSAACVIVSFVELGRICREMPRLREFFLPAFWFAAAVAVHQSAIIFLPFVLWIQFQRRIVDLPAALRCAAAFAILGFAVAGSFELWCLVVFGLEAKLSNNPTVYYRDENISVWLNTARVIVGTFIPDFGHLFDVWRQNDIPKSLTGFATKVYFTLSDWVTASAGTFLLCALPFWPLASQALRKIRSLYLRNPRALAWLAVVVTLVIIFHALLTPYSAPHGSMSVGLAPLALMAAYYALSTLQDSAKPSERRAALISTGLLCTLPWFALNLPITAALGLPDSSQSLWEKLDKHESDTVIILNERLVSLGLASFPWLLFASVGCVLWLGIVLDRRSDRVPGRG